MPRWDPDASSRLLEAGMALYFERGYADVTVAEIAERAGLTKRTFFRHFADKREIPFVGAASFEAAVVAGVAAAPAERAPVDVAVGALADASAELARWAEYAAARRALVASAPELAERELSKRDAVTVAIAGALRERGVESLAATLTAQAAVAVFTTGYDRWVDGGATADLPALVRATLGDLRRAVC
jgi:AcrR family transcriptional regulator